MSDPRMVAIRVTANGSTLRAATEEAYKRLEQFYGVGHPILLCELHINPTDSAEPYVVEVTATGYHRPGQLLRCTRSHEYDTLVAFDTPCLTKGYGYSMPGPLVPDSVVGMQRGASVYVLDGDQWVTTKVQNVEYIDDSNVSYYKRFSTE